MSAAPEPLLTLEQACRLYFPGKSAVALRWMIKRRGYAHSKWGREYRLTPSQVAAIVDALARPAQAPPALPPARRARPACRASGATTPSGLVPGPGGGAPPASRKALEARLSAPLSTPGDAA